MKKLTQRLAQQLFGAIAFYTTIPVSTRWTLDFTRIARFAPLVGLLLGGVLFLLIQFLSQGLPSLLCAVIIVALWLKLTGALHLDGAMDAADGLGVFDPAKRLEVMSDSRSGAFGVITGVMLILLKVVAMSELIDFLSLLICLVPVWGRFAHVLAIGQYPYLKKEGKAAMHHENFVPPWDYIPGLLTLLFIAGIIALMTPNFLLVSILCFLIAPLTSWGVGRWFYSKFQGMTGDLHGAIVEWTETLVLIEIVGLSKILQPF